MTKCVNAPQLWTCGAKACTAEARDSGLYPPTIGSINININGSSTAFKEKDLWSSVLMHQSSEDLGQTSTVHKFPDFGCEIQLKH